MQYVFVLDKNKQPLDPCHPARALEESVTHAHQIKLDPGSRTSGIAMVREGDNKVLWAGELAHRGLLIKAARMTGEPFVKEDETENAATARPVSTTAGGRRAGCLPAWIAGWPTCRPG